MVMPMPTPSPSVTAAAVDAGLPQSLVDLAQVVGALFTAAGVIVALFAALGGRARQRRVDHRDQATRVSVHTEKRDPTGAMARFSREVTVAVIINASQSPVYSVVVGAGHRSAQGRAFMSGNDANWIVAVVPPGMFEVAYPKRLREHEEYQDKDGVTRTREVIDGFGPRGATITFRDGNGVTWQRDARGRLWEATGTPEDARGLTEPLPWSDVQSG